MKEAKTKDLWVFVETNEDGTAKNVGLELLGKGRELADKQQGNLCAVVIGSGIDAAIDAANKAGADVIYAVDGPEYKQYSKGWKTLADMIAYAKENPGKVRYSTVFGSTTEYVGTMLERQAGVEFDNINVGTSGGERMAAMLGGQVDILAANYMQVKDYIEKGDLVCLAVMSKQRVPGIDYPTFTELGYDKVVTAKKYEVKFPKGTDKAIVDKLAAICKEIVLNDKTYADVLKVYFAQPLYRDAEQMNKEDPEEVKELEAGLAAE